jgi:hypothetical protein
MAGSYSAEHAGALADVAAAGAPVTFTLDSPGTEGVDGLFTGASSVSVAGHATEDGGDAAEYERLRLAPSEAPRLFFVPTTEGDEPSVGASCTWGGRSHIVRSSKPYRPAGTALFAYVIAQRGSA